jgi:tRNA A37 methylthiotransferase MiaB
MVTRTCEVRTYGCQMNVHDSERIAGPLDEAGYAPVADGAQPDVVVFSTCAVRENADNKLDGNLGHLKPVKDRTPEMPPLDRFVVVCRSQSDSWWRIKSSTPTPRFSHSRGSSGDAAYLCMVSVVSARVSAS